MGARKRGFGLAALISLLISCSPGGGPHQPVQGEGLFHGHADYNQVRPIFARYCSACHPARSQPDWLDYSQALAFVRNGMLKTKLITERSMPPPGSPQAASIPDSARQTVAAWIAAGGPKSDAAAAGGGKGSEVQPTGAQSCMQCHGEGSGQAKIPSLAGQNFGYMAHQLKQFKWRERIDPSGQMNDVASGLSPKSIQSLASYFSRLKRFGTDRAPHLHGQDSEEFNKGGHLARRLCNSCHMNSDYSRRPTTDELPVLAGQSKQYLINQLLFFRDGERKNALMNELASSLTNDDIQALATFYCNVR